MQGVLIRSPSGAFAFGITASQLRAVSGGPSAVRASGYGGTGAVTTPASPTTIIDRSHGVPMPGPATLRADLAAVCRVGAVETRRTRLTGVGRVYPFHHHARPLRLVGQEHGELVERPGGDQASGCAGQASLGPAACACGVPDRPLADAGEAFQTDDTPPCTWAWETISCESFWLLARIQRRSVPALL